MLEYTCIKDYLTHRGERVCEVRLSYEVAGPKLGTAPIVLVCHALTGNSSVAEERGWWGSLIGKGQTIDTDRYTVLAFNIPGNGYDGVETDDHRRYNVRDIAQLFIQGLANIGIDHLHTIIGASLGGGVVWQIAALAPRLAKQIVPVATDYRVSDWLSAQTLVQEHILEHSSRPIEDARIHAMLCYRTPQSLNARFSGQSLRTPGVYDVVSWLEYHGDTLAGRFRLSAYRVMTYLTGDVRVADDPSGLAHIESTVHLISIDTDLLFTHDRAESLYDSLKSVKPDTTLGVIRSIHGHDAFLMEYSQLSALLAPYF